MICSKEEFRECLEADLRATGIGGSNRIYRMKDKRFKFYRALRLAHTGPVIVSAAAVAGDFARAHVGVNIGRAYAKGADGAPRIGDRCRFGPGAKLFGPSSSEPTWPSEPTPS